MRHLFLISLLTVLGFSASAQQVNPNAPKNSQAYRSGQTISMGETREASSEAEEEEPETDEMEQMDRSARDAAEKAVYQLRDDQDEPEERETPAVVPPPIRLSQVPSAPSSASATDGASSTSPLEILKGARRVYIPEEGVPTSAVPVRERETPEQRSPVGRETQDKKDRRNETRSEKPGVVRGVLGHIPIIGKRIVPDRKRDQKAPEASESPERERNAFREREMEDIESGSPLPSHPEAGQTPPVLLPPPGTELDYPSTTATATPSQTPATPDIETPTPAPTIEVPPASTRTPVPTIAATPLATRTAPIPVVVAPPKAATPLATTPRAAATPKPVPTSPPVTNAEISETTATPATATVAATAISGATPTVTPFSAAVAPTATAAPQSSPTLEANDLGMPNPKAEPNDMVRSEYANAITAAREGNYSRAAQLLRDYAGNHPSSKLAARALYLSVILEPDLLKAADATTALREKFPDSVYIRDLQRRVANSEDNPALIEVLAKQLDRTPTGAESLETRRKLARLYIKQEQFANALAVLDPAVDLAAGTPQEAEIQDLLTDCYLARGEVEKAIGIIADLQQRFPEYSGYLKLRLKMGLANEALGNYPRALAEYRILIQEAPSSSEARTARGRIKDLERLSQ